MKVVSYEIGSGCAGVMGVALAVAVLVIIVRGACVIVCGGVFRGAGESEFGNFV